MNVLNVLKYNNIDCFLYNSGKCGGSIHYCPFSSQPNHQTKENCNGFVTEQQIVDELIEEKGQLTEEQIREELKKLK